MGSGADHGEDLWLQSADVGCVLNEKLCGGYMVEELCVWGGAFLRASVLFMKCCVNLWNKVVNFAHVVNNGQYFANRSIGRS